MSNKVKSGLQLLQYAGEECVAISMGMMCDPRTGVQGEVFVVFTDVNGKPVMSITIDYDTFGFKPTAREIAAEPMVVKQENTP